MTFLRTFGAGGVWGMMTKINSSLVNLHHQPRMVKEGNKPFGGFHPLTKLYNIIPLNLREF
ncbi:MAG TPA: hypothetical protein DE315_04120 [Candidatus Omnitrophica bacterium]|nr:MAG: hypothetical protein A2Y05_04585 [Omnitrophica WOR_2 bacterium GWA2_53_43]HBO97680.1 hypothetical protein [Candidatus Omnitrophota bacterium]HCI44701.1 hypothetical protein [Candidatus Omnitrophota bacterium]